MNEVRAKLVDKRMMILIGSQILMGLLLAVVIYFFHQQASESKGQNVSHFRELGNKLQAVGILKESIKQYEKYYTEIGENHESKAQMAFTLGELNEQIGHYEISLSWYYATLMYDTGSKYKEDANKRIVFLLEKLKKFTAAKFALKESTKLPDNQDKVKSGDVILAQIGSKNVYLNEVNMALDRLPPMYKKSFETKEGKKQFAQKYIYDVLLYQKGLRQDLDKLSEVRKKIDEISKQIVIQKLMENEIHQKISITDSDVENYYKANQEKYRQKESLQISYIKVKEKKKINEIKQAFNKGSKFAELVKKYTLDEASKKNEGRLSSLIDEDTSYLGLSKTQRDKVWKTSVGKLSSEILSGGFYYLFKIDNKIDEKIYKYDEIKDQVTQDYKQEKGQTLYLNLINESLKTEDVQLFLDKVQ